MGQVISKVNEATSSFKGMKVPVELDINLKTKTFEVHVASPPVSALLKKEFGLEKASGDHKNKTVANASIEQLISIAKTKQSNMLSKDLKAAVKCVAGTCISLGILVESKSAKETIEDINNGKYDSEIKSVKTTMSPEKKKQMDEYLNKVKSQQEKLAKQAQEAAAAAAAEAPAATTAASVPAAAAPAAKASSPGKAEEKKPAAKAAAKPAKK
jgi:large subunit ribosomal protein L11